MLTFQVGSTEWVEENREMLASKVVAYLNVDIAVSGPGFQASATPQLDQLIIDATKQVITVVYNGGKFHPFTYELLIRPNQILLK